MKLWNSSTLIGTFVDENLAIAWTVLAVDEALELLDTHRHLRLPDADGRALDRTRLERVVVHPHCVPVGRHLGHLLRRHTRHHLPKRGRLIGLEGVVHPEEGTRGRCRRLLWAAWRQAVARPASPCAPC